MTLFFLLFPGPDVGSIVGQPAYFEELKSEMAELYGSLAEQVRHKVHIYTEYHSVCPLVAIGLSFPLSGQRVCPSPRYQMGGGGVYSPAGEGLGGPNSDDWRKSLALRLRCELRA
jgi:hypothetical protein